MKVTIIILSVLLAVAIVTIYVLAGKFKIQKEITRMCEQQIRELEAEKVSLRAKLSEKAPEVEQSDSGYQGH